MPNFNGEARFSYTVSDGNGGFDTAVMRVDVAPVNDAPEAFNNRTRGVEDTPVIIDPATQLLRNDFDIDGDSLAVVSVQDARNGSVVLNADGTITFTPDANFNGEARFSYTVSDGNGGFDTAVMRVDVAPVNDAPEAFNNRTRGVEDTPVIIDPATQLLRNDFDIDGDSLAVVSVQDARNGSVVLMPTVPSPSRPMPISTVRRAFPTP